MPAEMRKLCGDCGRPMLDFFGQITACACPPKEEAAMGPAEKALRSWLFGGGVVREDPYTAELDDLLKAALAEARFGGQSDGYEAAADPHTDTIHEAEAAGEERGRREAFKEAESTALTLVEMVAVTEGEERGSSFWTGVRMTANVAVDGIRALTSQPAAGRKD